MFILFCGIHTIVCRYYFCPWFALKKGKKLSDLINFFLMKYILTATLIQRYDCICGGGGNGAAANDDDDDGDDDQRRK